jgi:transcriptional regulator with XRE-family HTH domain
MALKRVEPYDIEIGRRIRAQRLATGMSQELLADQLGITFQQVQKYEKGANRVSAGRLRRIAEIFGVPPAFFFSDLDTPATDTTEATTSGFEFLTTARAIRMMRAFSRLSDTKLQNALVAVCEMMADEERRT